MRSIFQTTDNSALVIANPDTKVYIIQLVGKISQKKYKTAFEYVLEDVDATHYQKILLNIKDLESTPDTGKRWLATHFIPRFHKKSKKIILAVIPPKNTLDKANFNLITTLAKTLGVNIRLKFFTNIIVAENWLNKISEIKLKPKANTKKNQKNVPDFLKDMDLEDVLDDESIIEEESKKSNKFSIKFKVDRKGNMKGKSKGEIKLSNLTNKAKGFSFNKWIKSLGESSIKLEKVKRSKDSEGD